MHGNGREEDDRRVIHIIICFNKLPFQCFFISFSVLISLYFFHITRVVLTRTNIIEPTYVLCGHLFVGDSLDTALTLSGARFVRWRGLCQELPEFTGARDRLRVRFGAVYVSGLEPLTCPIWSRSRARFGAVYVSDFGVFGHQQWRAQGREGEGSVGRRSVL